METIEKKIPYITVKNTQVIRLITNTNKISKAIQANLQQSQDPALIATMDYLEKTYKNKQCPFVPIIHEKNLYYALLYNQNEGENINFEKFFAILEPTLQYIRKQHEQEDNRFIDSITLFAVFADPTLATKTFSNKAETAIMQKKWDFIKDNRMWWAMLADPKAWATRTSNPGQEENPMQHNIDHPFKINGYNALAYRYFHPGSLHKMSKTEVKQKWRSAAITYGDIGSVRTPQDMIACLESNPNQAKKYINLFINFLWSKTHNDKKYINDLQPWEKDPDDIILFLYEHYLINIPSHCIHGIKSLLQVDFTNAKNILIETINKTEKIYQDIIQLFTEFNADNITFDDMKQELQTQIEKLANKH